MALPEAFTTVLDGALEWIYGLEPVFAPTVVLVPTFLDGIMESLSGLIGLDVPTLRYVLGMYLAYPLAMIMNTLPFGKARHLFSFLCGAFLIQYTVGVQWMHQLITSLVVYAMFCVLPRKTCATVVPAFVMLYCVLGHLHRQYINYLGWDLDFTSAQMVITQKLWMMAFNLYDGEVLAKDPESRAAKKCAPFALKELPGLIEFLGYTFCFGGVLSGPAYEYSVYASACDGSILYKPDGTPKGKIPSNIWPTLLPLFTSFINMAVYLVIGGMFPLMDPEDPQKNTPVLLTEDFLSNPWYYRYAYMWIGLIAVRQKYYLAWKCAEGAMNLWYMGFDGFDDKGNPKGWETSNNQDIMGFETAPNISSLSKDWNKKSSLWLTRYVYIRTNGSLLAVYSLSAFWHGFYPGYYLFFLSVPLLTVCERLGKKKISPYFSSDKWSPYGIVCILATSFVVEYLVSPFVMLSLEWSWANYKNNYFFGHVGCLLFYAIVSQLPTPPQQAKKKAA